MLAAFNLVFRLSNEVVTEWDESLYAINAWEMLKSGHWITTTFGGALDYYNTKPPLNVWLIALSFKAFGVSLVSLRITSVVSAWLTVAVLQRWLRQTAGAGAAILASLILATCFPFLYTHAGRSANTDALFALLILLAVVTSWAGQTRPWRLVWLGPILGATFLLKGMGVLMPIAIVGAVELWHLLRRHQRRWTPLVLAIVLAGVPIASWIWARWQIDRWTFLDRLFNYDFVQGTTTALEGHEGAPWFYLRLLVGTGYAWLAAGVAACVLCPVPWRRSIKSLMFWRSHTARRMLLGLWAALTLLIPTVMRTKLPWYLNPFYPVFAAGVGWVIARAIASSETMAVPWRRWVLIGSLAIALAASEGHLVWYSYHNRDLGLSVQGTLLRMRDQLTGRRVFRDTWANGDIFVGRAFVDAETREVDSLQSFLRESQPGDYFFSRTALTRSDMDLAIADDHHWIYRRKDATTLASTAPEIDMTVAPQPVRPQLQRVPQPSDSTSQRRRPFRPNVRSGPRTSR